MTVRIYNSKVVPREMQEGNVVLRQVVIPTWSKNLLPKWQGLYQIYQKLPHDAYKHEELNKKPIPIT